MHTDVVAAELDIGSERLNASFLCSVRCSSQTTSRSRRVQPTPVGTRERCRVDNIVARVDVGDEEVASALAAALSLVRASVQR